MLEIANVGPKDVVYDLGCGDGRILIAAAELFNVRKAVGYDIRKTCIKTSSEKSRGRILERK